MSGAAICAAALVFSGLPADAAPRLRPGLWQFDRTIENNGTQTGRRIIDHLAIAPRIQRCVDPNVAMRAKFADTTLGICRLTKTEHNDGEHVLSRSCAGSGRVTTTVKATSEESFEETIEGRIGGTLIKDSVTAQRLGACPRHDRVSSRRR